MRKRYAVYLAIAIAVLVSVNTKDASYPSLEPCDIPEASIRNVTITPYIKEVGSIRDSVYHPVYMISDESIAD